MNGTAVKRGALATALASLALLDLLQLLLGLPVASPASVLSLVATIVALQALALTPRLLPVSLALYAAGIVLAVHQGDLTAWSVPALAAALLVLVESTELRARVAAGWAVERRAVGAHLRQLAWIALLGLGAATTALATASLTSRGGAVTGIVGAAAVIAALFLIRTLARSGTSWRSTG